jgi:hypothetical protein
MTIEADGQADVQIGPLRIWVHGRQFPEAVDAWDGNWLYVTAQYSASGASVTVSGPILDTVSFATFGEQLQALYESLAGQAKLESAEPNLTACINALGPTGRMELRVDLTQDNIAQGHWFVQEIDQSYLPTVIAACETVLQRYSVRDGGRRGA